MALNEFDLVFAPPGFGRGGRGLLPNSLVIPPEAELLGLDFDSGSSSSEELNPFNEREEVDLFAKRAPVEEDLFF